MMALLLQIIYVAWVVWLAYINKQWIARAMTVRHWANGVAHGMAMFALYISFGWNYALALPFIVRVFFDGSLSLFRGLSFDYVSPAPKSFFDKIEKRIFKKNAILPRCIYLAAAIALNMI